MELASGAQREILRGFLKTAWPTAEEKQQVESALNGDVDSLKATQIITTVMQSIRQRQDTRTHGSR